MPSKKDPSEAIRKKAASLAGVDQGSACTQTSFKVGTKSFLFVGMQGGRHKLMLKLRDSMNEAKALAKKKPDNFEVGSTGWVTIRFADDDPIPRKIWEPWIRESYEMSAPAKKAGKASKKKTASKKTAVKKTTTRKTTSKKSVPARNGTSRKSTSKNTTTRKTTSKKVTARKGASKKTTTVRKTKTAKKSATSKKTTTRKAATSRRR